MRRIAVDMNLREDGSVVVLPKNAKDDHLSVGDRVILYEHDDIECQAILRRGQSWEWVADIVEGTIKKTAP